jgi:hypothetical protein
MNPCHNGVPAAQTVRCAIYTRKSTEEGLEQEFDSLDAQREAAEAYLASQQHQGWMAGCGALGFIAGPRLPWSFSAAKGA